MSGIKVVEKGEYRDMPYLILAINYENEASSNTPKDVREIDGVYNHILMEML